MGVALHTHLSGQHDQRDHGRRGKAALQFGVELSQEDVVEPGHTWRGDETKKAAADRVAALWDVDPDVLEALAREDHIWDGYLSEMPPNERAAGFIRSQLSSWTGSSGGPIAAKAITAVADRLGVGYQLAEYERSSQDWFAQRPAYDKAMADLGEAMYAATQQWLADRNIGSIRLRRRSTRGPEWDSKRPWTSWSVSEGGTWLAGEMGRLGANRDEVIPAERIFSLPTTGFGNPEEWEVVVLGKPTKPVVAAAAPSDGPAQVEGLTPEELEEQGAILEEVVAVALAVVAASAAAEILAVPVGVAPTVLAAPWVSLDDVAVMATQWLKLLDSDIMPVVRETVDDTADFVRRQITEALPTLYGQPEDDDVDVAVPTEVPPIPDVTADLIMQAARNRLVGIGDVVWANARQQLADGIREGDSIQQLADRVRTAAAVSEPRARMIARTEIAPASNGAAIAQARSSGVPMRKIWIETPDDRTRLTHKHEPIGAGGQIRDLDEPFDVGGFLLDFPGDPTGPPQEVINERCSIGFLLGAGEPVVAAARKKRVFNESDVDRDDQGQFADEPSIKVPKGRKPRSAKTAPKAYPTPTATESDTMQDVMLDGGAWTPAQRKALRDYTWNDYQQINDTLRYGIDLDKTDPVERKRIRQIRDIHATMRPTTEPIRVFRNADLKSLGIKTFQPDRIRTELKGLKGKTLQDAGFMSTSIDAGAVADKQVRLEINVPAGASAAFIRRASKNKQENEWLLDAGTQFRVVSVDDSGSPVVVAVEVLV